MVNNDLDDTVFRFCIYIIIICILLDAWPIISISE